MRGMIAIALLLTLCACAFAADKAIAKRVKPQPSSTGILFEAFFDFDIVGDGISTTFTIDPRRIPPRYNGGASTFPHLPLVGVFNGNGFVCGQFEYVGTLSNGLLTLTFA